MTTDDQLIEESRMSLIDHLAELRNRLIISAVSIAVGAVICWIFYPQILDFLIEPYNDICDVEANTGLPGSDGCALLVTDPLEGFSVRITVAAYGGLFLAIPVVLWQVWRFISPGLYRRERRYGAIFVVSGAVLFLLGAALAYWSVPRALDFLTTVGGEDLLNVFSPRKYINFVVKMMIAFGLGFEFPILLIFLQLVGIVDNRTLRRGRQYALVGIVVLVAVITPSGDPITLMILSVPMYIFYEIAILFGVIRERRRRKAGITA